MRFVVAILTGLFGVAAVGILIWNYQPLDSLGVALALALLCFDQGRMALVDLDNIRQVTLKDKRVQQFQRLTLGTIALELTGFYLAWLQLGMGTAIVLISQLFFNSLAKIQLAPNQVEPIQHCPLPERSAVLMANIVALGLITLWQLGQLRWISAVLLLTMVIVYLGVKYLTDSFISAAKEL